MQKPKAHSQHLNRRLRGLTSRLLPLLALLAASATSCDDSLARARAGGLRVGYAIEAPYAVVEKSGRVSGESPDTARAVALALGIPEPRFVHREFGQLIAGLRAGDYDVIAAGLFISKDREKLIAFSDPSLRAKSSLLVAKGNPLGLNSYAQAIAKGGAIIATIKGSYEEKYFRDRLGASSRVLGVPDALSGRLAVENSLADCLALSHPSVLALALGPGLGYVEEARPFIQSPEFEMGGAGYAAFGFRRADGALLRAWNKALKAHLESPEHLEILKRNGLGREDLPGGISAREVLAK